MKKTKKIKLLPLNYINTNCPIAGDVTDFIKAVKHFRLKNGHKPYQKDRDRADLLVRRLLQKHNIAGTISAYFWYLDGMVILRQKTDEQYRKELHMAQRAAASSKVCIQEKVHAERSNSDHKKHTTSHSKRSRKTTKTSR